MSMESDATVGHRGHQKVRPRPRTCAYTPTYTPPFVDEAGWAWMLLLLGIAYWMFLPFQDTLVLPLALAIAPEPKHTDL